ncbi:MAG TPA: nitronate monooxygenase [Fimbriimonadaceae bacterium]|nr:nitronate monooxygenase [Fimbriimonadaceae bacterium]
MPNSNNEFPRIIQGGMGVGVSGWRLARAVSQAGQLGVVSGTAVDAVLVRKLQLGDPHGNLANAFRAFPLPDIANRIWQRYYIEGGKAASKPFRAKPIFTFPLSASSTELILLANFVEVYLAKHGHAGLVGINLLEKNQIATLPSLLGAMLADVDFVMIGAGIPREIPAALDRLASLQTAQLTLDIAGNSTGEPICTTLDPGEFSLRPLKRPKFLAIVSSTTLAQSLAKRCTPPVDGFIIEGFTAGGHNAPPRGEVRLDADGQPIYGERDIPNLELIRSIGLPFWLAGSFGSAERFSSALELGAEGIQVGTPFAFCEESGIDPEIKAIALRKSIQGDAKVYTDLCASPTGFPFKVADIPGSLSEESTFSGRERVCDLGYLRQMVKTGSGKIEYRCPAEPVENYVRKGGAVADTVGRKCLCNGLTATIGLGQVRTGGYQEPSIVTAGTDIASIAKNLRSGATSYTAQDVIDRILLPPRLANSA